MKTAQLIEIFGGNASLLAKILGITPQAIYQWPEYVPRAWGYEIEARTKGRVKYVPEPGSAAELSAQINICTFVQKYEKAKREAA